MQIKGSFGGYLREEFPSQLIVDVTEYNNASRSYAPHTFAVRSPDQPRRNMSAILHQKLVNEVKASGIEYCRFVRYGGMGEPLLHPDIIDFLTSMSETGMRTVLVTNGLLLTNNMCRDLVRAGVTAIEVTIDAYKGSTYDSLWQGGALKDVQMNVMNLINASRIEGRSTKVITSFTVQNQNDGEEEAFTKFWEDHGVDQVLIKQPVSMGGDEQGSDQQLWESSDEDRDPCLYPWEQLYLCVKGLLHYCPIHVGENTSIGDFNKKTIVELWSGTEMKKLRQAHKTNNFECHAKCGGCPDWFLSPWPKTRPKMV